MALACFMVELIEQAERSEIDQRMIEIWVPAQAALLYLPVLQERLD